MSDVGKVDWAPDYGLPIMRPTQCKTGTHVWVTTGRDPKPGDICHCGLREWQAQIAGTRGDG